MEEKNTKIIWTTVRVGKMLKQGSNFEQSSLLFKKLPNFNILFCLSNTTLFKIKYKRRERKKESRYVILRKKINCAQKTHRFKAK